MSAFSLVAAVVGSGSINRKEGAGGTGLGMWAELTWFPPTVWFSSLGNGSGEGLHPGKHPACPTALVPGTLKSLSSPCLYLLAHSRASWILAVWGLPLERVRLGGRQVESGHLVCNALSALQFTKHLSRALEF